MTQWKGYERFLKNANPKLAMTQKEFWDLKSNREEVIGRLEKELETEQPRLLKLSRSKQRYSFVFLSLLAAVGLFVNGLLQKDPMLRVGFWSVAALFLISGLVTIGTIQRKSRLAPKNLGDLQTLVQAYYDFHTPMVNRSDNYDEYQHHASMGNESKFLEIYSQLQNPNSPA